MKDYFRRVRSFVAPPQATPWERGFVLVLLLAGLVFRARGFLFEGRPLWLDEAAWSVDLVRGTVDDTIRPVGFMTLTRFIVAFSTSEEAFRLLPWLAGLVTTLLAPRLAARLFTAGAARVLFVAIIALHPCAIDFSKEFKPYSVSLLCHSALLLGTLRAIATGKTVDVLLALAVACVGTLFAQDLVFAYPGAFLVLGWDALKHRRRHLPLVIGAAALVLCSLGAQYVLIWSRIPKTESAYWADKYDVFHPANDGHSYLRWALAKFGGLLEFPGERRRWWGSSGTPWPELVRFRMIDAALWLLASLAGAARLVVRRDVRSLLLLVLPLFVLWLFNALGFWPFGVFRTNLFVLVYTAALAAAAADGPWIERRAWLAVVPAVVLVLLPLFAFERHWHGTKRAFAYDGHFPPTVRELELLRKQAKKKDPVSHRDPLLLFDSVCPQFDYYTQVHPRAANLRKRVEKLFVVRCVSGMDQMPAELAAAASSGDRVWILVEGDSDIDTAIRRAPGPALEVVTKAQVSIIHIVAVVATPT